MEMVEGNSCLYVLEKKKNFSNVYKNKFKDASSHYK